MGAFSSCKDNAEEIYHDLRADNEAQKQALLTDVNQMISDAFTNNACKDACKCVENWKAYCEKNGINADLNGDGVVDANDYYAWILKDDNDGGSDTTLAKWKEFMTLKGIADMDLNGDGVVDENDMFAYLLNCDDQACKDAADLATEIYKALMETEDGLSTDPAVRADQLKAYRDRVLQLVADLEDMRAAYTELVTNVQVNATENALVGYLNTPFGLSSKTLFAFYGKAHADVAFPLSTAGYVEDAEVLTADELAFIGNVETYDQVSGQVIVASEEGNAGTVYLTLNPNNVNFTDKEVALVNSQNKGTDIKLSALKKSDKVLQFGYTRADEHYLYEAAATVDADAINGDNVNKIEWDKDELKQTAKDLVSAVRNRSISEIASFVYDKLNPELDAYGIQTAYRGLTIDGVEAQNTVVSNYEIAAAAIEAPNLSLVKTVQDKFGERNKFYGYDRIHSFIDRAAKKFHFDFPVVNIKDLTIDKIELNDLEIKDEKINKFRVRLSTYLKVDNDQYYISYSDERHSWTIHEIATDKWVNDIELADATIADLQSSPKPEYIPAIVIIDLTDAIKDVIGDVYGQAQAPINDVNKMIDDINNYLADVNEALDQLNSIEDKVNGAVDSAVKSVYRVLDAFNRRAVNAMGKLDYLVKPALLYKGEEGTKMLSRSKYMPTTIAANSDFVATSMSAEVLVPFAKKHVAVVNVFDAAGNVAADAQAKAAAVNGLNEVVDGGERAVAASGFEAGYIYELAYSVVDYAGYVSTRRFFVTVK